MSFNKIINPKTNRSVSIYSNLGKKILENYVDQVGGSAALQKKRVYLKYNGKYINDKLELTDSPYEWIYENNTLISHRGTALDTYTDSSNFPVGKLTTWNLNENINQQFLLQNEMVKTLNGNRAICYMDELIYSPYCTNQITYQFLGEPTIDYDDIDYISYNILTPLPMYENDFNVDPKYKHWGKGREQLIKQTIKGKQLGVLVECIESTLDYLLESDMDYVFCVKAQGNTDGTAIIYNKNMFTVKKVYRAEIVKGRVQVVIGVNFISKLTGKEFIVIGLHLKSGEKQYLEDRREKEMARALNLVLTGIDPKIPVIVSGDFNSCFQTGVNFGYTQKALTPLIKNGFKQVPLKSGQITYKYWQESVFDYVFIRGDSLTALDELDSGEYYNTNPAPNSKHGSDHFPVSVTLRLN